MAHDLARRRWRATPRLTRDWKCGGALAAVFSQFFTRNLKGDTQFALVGGSPGDVLLCFDCRKVCGGVDRCLNTHDIAPFDVAVV